MPRPAPVTMATWSSSRNRSWIMAQHGTPRPERIPDMTSVTDGTFRRIPDAVLPGRTAILLSRARSADWATGSLASRSSPGGRRVRSSRFLVLPAPQDASSCSGWSASSSSAAVSGAVGGSFGQDFSPPASRAPVASTRSNDEFGGSGGGHPRHDRVPRRRRASTTPRCRPRWSSSSRWSTTIAADPDVDVSNDPGSPASTPASARALEDADLSCVEGHDRRQPLRPEGGRQIAGPRAPRPARSPSPRSRSPVTTGRTSATIGRTLEEIVPARRRPAGRARRPGLRRVRGAVVGDARPRLRRRDPRGGLRLGAGHGPAHRRGPRRHRCRLGHRHDPVEPRSRCRTSPRSSGS